MFTYLVSTLCTSCTVFFIIFVTAFLRLSDNGSAPVNEFSPVSGVPFPDTGSTLPRLKLVSLILGLAGWNLVISEISVPKCKSSSLFAKFIKCFIRPADVKALSLSEIMPAFFGRNKSSRLTPIVMLFTFCTFSKVCAISILS